MSQSTKAPPSGFHPASSSDYLPLAQLRELQFARLQAMVRRAHDHQTLYRERMAEKGVSPGDIQSLEDAAKLPFTVKTDLRETYPFGLFACTPPAARRASRSSSPTRRRT